MCKNEERNVIERPPNPEFLIKSIAEQGYSLETAFADLIDNSISANANKIEILNNDFFEIFICDNGEGMSNEQLIQSLTLPSDSIENERNKKDLGRFGLGLKTASFSQTRELVVISRKKDQNYFNAYSWDLALLRQTKNWTLKKISDSEINEYLESYNYASNNHLNKFDDYYPNTIIIWKGLYKYESFLNEENKKKALYSDLSKNVEEYLSIAFHRFIEKGLAIRLNNKIIKEFNPFPDIESIIRLQKRRGKIKNSVIKFESIVLPYRALKESINGLSIWSTPSKSLMDMEGIYIYRGDRLISFGGWHRILKRSGKLQLARIKIDIENDIDDILKLNVAKSQIEIPFELKEEFNASLNELSYAAQKEFYNTGLKESGISGKKQKQVHQNIFQKVYTNNGVILYINNNNPLVKFLIDSFDEEQRSLFNVFLKNINSIFNKNRQIDTDVIIKEDKEKLALVDVETTVAKLRALGLDEDTIKTNYLNNVVPKKEIDDII